MKQHCYLHVQYQETCRGCRLAARYATAHESALSNDTYNTAREDDDTSTSSVWTAVADISYDTTTDTSSNDTSSSDSSSSSDSFGGFDGGSSGGGGSDF